MLSDVLVIRILPACARHAVFTLADSMMFGIHCFIHTQLKRSFSGFVCTAFASNAVTNADHGEFLSVIQASATLWAPCFSPLHREALSEDDIGKSYLIIMACD